MHPLCGLYHARYVLFVSKKWKVPFIMKTYIPYELGSTPISPAGAPDAMVSLHGALRHV